MKLMSLLVVSGLALVVFPALALGLGGDHPEGPVHKADHWADGFHDLANRKERVLGYWVNSEDVFFYSGDTKALNAFLVEYGGMKGASLELVLHVGNKQARAPWDNADRKVRADWTLYAAPRAWLRLKPGNNLADGPAVITRVDVWLNESVKLDDLAVPANIKVRSAGEIDKFIEAHRKKHEAPKP